MTEAERRRWADVRIVERFVRNARENLSIARGLLGMGCAGFAATSAHLAMRQLADALVFDKTSETFASSADLVAELRSNFVDSGALPKDLYDYLVDGQCFESVATEDYTVPPTLDRAREELARAEIFLAEAQGILGIFPEALVR